jgi:hypothetical protein
MFPNSSAARPASSPERIEPVAKACAVRPSTPIIRNIEKQNNGLSSRLKKVIASGITMPGP